MSNTKKTPTRQTGNDTQGSTSPSANPPSGMAVSAGTNELLRQLQALDRPFIDEVNQEIDALLQKIKEKALIRSENQIHMVNALVKLAVDASSFVEAMYSDPDKQPMIGLVACHWPKFATTFEFRLPTALRDKPRAFESSGDKMRRKLTKVWQERTPLPATGKTEFDYLRQVMEGFFRSIDCPSRTQPCAADKAGWTVLDWFLETHGAIPVDPTVRTELRIPENRRNARLWAEKFVDWYQTRHPWPSLDRQGNEIVTIKRDALHDPIHQIAFDRLNTLRKSNKKEKSPWNALRAVVREKFSAAFSLVKVEPSRDL